jgi:hypothetical protein
MVEERFFYKKTQYFLILSNVFFKTIHQLFTEEQYK